MFVGEGPGADEDAQGIPFVGRGGQLLNNMINAMGLKREQVYIANIVKCRPPAEPHPRARRSPHLLPLPLPAIDVIRPQVIVALGQTAVTYLTRRKRPSPAGAAPSTPCAEQSSSSPTTPPTCFATPTRNATPGKTSRSPCANSASNRPAALDLACENNLSRSSDRLVCRLRDGEQRQTITASAWLGANSS